MDELQRRSAILEREKFDLNQIRFTKPVEFKQERAADGTPVFIYRDRSGKEVPADTLGALKYRRFWGYPSTETVDFYDTIVEKQAVVKAFPQFILDGGGVRYMHNSDPVGRVFPDDYEERENGIYCGVSIPEYEERTLNGIDYKILTGFSLGWNSEINGILWPEEEGDKVRFVDIRIAEITICDTRATLGTHFREERTTLQSEDTNMIKEIYRWMKGLVQRSSDAGNPPATTIQTEDDDMTPEQHKELLEALNKRDTEVVGKITELVESLKPKDPPPGENEPDPKDPKPEDEIKERIAEAIKPLHEEITALKRATNTEEPLGGSLQALEEKVKAYEKFVDSEVEKRKTDGEPELTDDQKLGFIGTQHGRLTTALMLNDDAWKGDK